MTIEIKSIVGSTLYTTEAESIKEAVEKAVKEKVSLDWASLDGASLDGASLDGASLDGASLNRASLNNASLDGASLDGASLNNASLDGASLPIFCKWKYSYESDHNTINIGCKRMTIAEWDHWFNSVDEFETPRTSDDFKRIRATYEALKSYCLIMKA